MARVLGHRRHPDADRIQLVDVDAGDGEAAADRVRGVQHRRRRPGARWPPSAPSCPAAWRSAGARCGASGPTGCCARPPSSASRARTGKGILDPARRLAAPGTPLTEALGIEPDVVFDLDITPNRPDALSWPAWPGTWPPPSACPSPSRRRPARVDAAIGAATIEVEAPDLCPRFTATVLAGVTVGPSPAWLARRLTLAGMRPITNVVDVSNYVMLELGQPTHAYDLDRLPGGAWSSAGPGPARPLVTLDGVERRLERRRLPDLRRRRRRRRHRRDHGRRLIEITDATTTVLLEAAYFTPMAIARTGKRLGLRSEARARFERGVDPEVVDRAVDRFAACWPRRPPAPRSRLDADVDVRRAPAPPPSRVRTARVNAILGTSSPTTTVAGLLAPIGFAAAPARRRRHGSTSPRGVPTASGRSTSSRRWPASTATATSRGPCRCGDRPAAA